MLPAIDQAERDLRNLRSGLSGMMVVRQESRHGPTMKGRDAIVIRLGHLFDYYYRGGESGRALVKVDFVNSAMRARGIPLPRLKDSRAAHSRLVRLVKRLCPRCDDCARRADPASLSASGERGQRYPAAFLVSPATVRRTLNWPLPGQLSPAKRAARLVELNRSQ